jgi:putative sigma-54 modulation protein
MYILTRGAENQPNKGPVSVRFGIPGNDAFASDSGDNFMALLKSVEEKLRRQLEKK